MASSSQRGAGRQFRPSRVLATPSLCPSSSSAHPLRPGSLTQPPLGSLPGHVLSLSCTWEHGPFQTADRNGDAPHKSLQAPSPSERCGEPSDRGPAESRGAPAVTLKQARLSRGPRAGGPQSPPPPPEARQDSPLTPLQGVPALSPHHCRAAPLCSDCLLSTSLLSHLLLGASFCGSDSPSYDGAIGPGTWRMLREPRGGPTAGDALSPGCR